MKVAASLHGTAARRRHHPCRPAGEDQATARRLVTRTDGVDGAREVRPGGGDRGPGPTPPTAGTPTSVATSIRTEHSATIHTTESTPGAALEAYVQVDSPAPHAPDASWVQVAPEGTPLSPEATAPPASPGMPLPGAPENELPSRAVPAPEPAFNLGPGDAPAAGAPPPPHNPLVHPLMHEEFPEE